MASCCCNARCWDFDTEFDGNCCVLLNRRLADGRTDHVILFRIKKVFDTGVLRTLFGHKAQELIGGWRKMVPKSFTIYIFYIIVFG